MLRSDVLPLVRFSGLVVNGDICVRSLKVLSIAVSCEAISPPFI